MSDDQNLFCPWCRVRYGHCQHAPKQFEVRLPNVKAPSYMLEEAKTLKAAQDAAAKKSEQ